MDGYTHPSYMLRFSRPVLFGVILYPPLQSHNRVSMDFTLLGLRVKGCDIYIGPISLL